MCHINALKQLTVQNSNNNDCHNRLDVEQTVQFVRRTMNMTWHKSIDYEMVSTGKLIRKIHIENSSFDFSGKLICFKVFEVLENAGKSENQNDLNKNKWIFIRNYIIGFLRLNSIA